MTNLEATAVLGHDAACGPTAVWKPTAPLEYTKFSGPSSVWVPTAAFESTAAFEPIGELRCDHNSSADDIRAPQAQNRRRFQIKRQVQRRAQREVQRLRWMSNILPRRISPPRVFLRRDPLGQPQQTDLPNVSARPLTSTGLLPPPESNPPSREYIWGWIDRRDQGLSYEDLPTWLRDASQELSLKGAFDAMTELAGKIPGDTSAHFELLAKPVVDDFHHQNAPTPQESDSSMMVSQFAATQTRPYYAALFATKQGRHYGTSWHWWAIASVREAGPLDTTASDPGKPQHLFVYDSRPLQLDLEGLRTTRGLRDFLRNDQYRMLKRLNQAVPIKYLFLNQARLRMPDLSNRLQETLWWIFNVVSRGDMPIEIGSELSDLRWKAVDAITLEFEHDEQDTGANAERKLILRSIARAVER
ncbi:hypothetical protein ASPACDRAFT_41813 [Aspergillus aculeatus ATCC 16872]|uniref:Uncharacterized protein n=1 Tax=Aspergillus aculeatus (strain ATCC 16872 / CBS 172.66 / WB 5094) TaxID=690307 RepID=A0A1L9WZA1_ASPA1|nr:uncharacterized protein ASPACDRAFT_41813 [Aspergillus aculeatus ATCC 16872]OJK01550.1 hypothetical protein ASPACDRAFT_41813 [Aspergillus aculeatus ATCC 16872]